PSRPARPGARPRWWYPEKALPGPDHPSLRAAPDPTATGPCALTPPGFALKSQSLPLQAHAVTLPPRLSSTRMEPHRGHRAFTGFFQLVKVHSGYALHP